MNNIDNLREWLNHPDRKGVVSIRELEKRINCPRSTLGQWLTGKRPLPQKWEKPLLQQIEKLSTAVCECKLLCEHPEDKIWYNNKSNMQCNECGKQL